MPLFARTLALILLAVSVPQNGLAGIGADKYTNFEILTHALDTAVAEARETKGVLLVVARPGRGESARLAQFRLHVIRCYVSGLMHVPAQVFFAEGRSCPGAGRVELFLGGKRFAYGDEPIDLVMPRGGIANPWGEDPIGVLTPRNFTRFKGRCATHGHVSLEAPPN